jgi:toxin-antitoxin system PIN domain toxin
MTVYLLDVNLLLALCDPRHMHHELAHRWFADKGQSAWATCPITENGFIRIASHPSYPNSPGTTSSATTLLRKFRRGGRHRFWPDAVSLTDEMLFRLSPALSANQTTDVYLLGLAVKNGGALATLDRAIPTAAVVGGEHALEVITPGMTCAPAP